MDSIQKGLLLEYVTNSAPRLNKLLRNSESSPDIEIFDSLFSRIRVQEKLYRLLPEKSFKLSDGNVYYDEAYLSTSISIDNYIDRFPNTIRDIVCMEIETGGETECINIMKYLPNQNEEGEFILPRNLKLYLQDQIIYSKEKGFKNFLEEVNCDLLRPEHLDYDSIKLCKLSINKNQGAGEND